MIFFSLSLSSAPSASYRPCCPPAIQSGSNDEEVAEKAHGIRQLSEEEKAEYRGENHLRIIKDRDLLCRGEAVSRRDSELSQRRRRPCEEQKEQLS